MKNNINTKWDIDEAEAIYWIVAEASYSATSGMREVYGFGFSRIESFIDADHIFKWCTLKKEMNNLGNKCIAKFKSESFRKRIINDFKKLKIEIDQEIVALNRNNLRQLSLGDIFRHLELFTYYYKKNFSYGFFVEPFDYVFLDQFQKVISKYNLNSNEFSELTAVPDVSYLNTELQKLIKLLIQKNNGSDIAKKLKKHYLDYEWLATGHAGKKDINISYFVNRIKELTRSKKNLYQELDHLRNNKKLVLKKQRQIMNKYKFNKKVLTMIRIANDMAPLHDCRKELFVKTIFYADKIRQELAKRFGYSLADLQYFEYKELLALKKRQELDKREIARRHKFVLLKIDYLHKKRKFYSGIQAKRLVDPEFNKRYQRIQQLKGTIANNGKASGRIKIIFGAKNFYRMKQGDILVTGMTRPEMIPVMRKASAIVTDEGGITCHAAIVSRELKIPCLVNTQIATKVFKDNDKVEVDANNGIIKLIK